MAQPTDPMAMLVTTTQMLPTVTTLEFPRISMEMVGTMDHRHHMVAPDKASQLDHLEELDTADLRELTEMLDTCRLHLQDLKGLYQEVELMFTKMDIIMMRRNMESIMATIITDTTTGIIMITKCFASISLWYDTAF